MAIAIPNSKPKMGKSDVEKIISFFGIDTKKFPVNVLAVRGYYSLLGAKGKNDRGIWDDACFTNSPTLFNSVNWNTDPSSYKKGKGTGSGKGMASLKAGKVYDYKIGKHKGRGPAAREAGPVTVVRDGVNGNYEETDNPLGKGKAFKEFAINLHWGGNTTSSAGCQTAPPNQWPSFINPLVNELKRYNKTVFKYILITEEQRKDILGENNVAAAVISAKSAAENVTASNGMDAYKAKLEKEFEAAHKAQLASMSNTDPYIEDLINIIKEFEGFRSYAYLDQKNTGLWAIGYGTNKYPNGAPVKKGDQVTKEYALELLKKDIMEVRIPTVVNCISYHLTNKQICALVSLCYNIGVGAFKDSTLVAMINQGDKKLACADQFLRWVKDDGVIVQGLVRRREKERALFLSGAITV